MRKIFLIFSFVLLVACSEKEQATIVDSRDIEAGRISYHRQCGVCHGEDGAGDGVATPALAVPLRSIHDWIDGYDLDDFQTKLKMRHMPVFAHGQDTDKVFLYLKSLEL